MTQQDTRTVAIRIESIAPPLENAKAQRVKFLADDLGIKNFSTPTMVPTADIATLQASPGPFLVKLVKGKLQQNKTGEFDNQYFWEWGGFVDPSDAVALKPAQKGPKEPRTIIGDYNTAYTDKETAIRRAVALKAAVDLQSGSAIAETGQNNIVDATLSIAERFDAWLQGPQDELADAGIPPSDLPFEEEMPAEWKNQGP